MDNVKKWIKPAIILVVVLAVIFVLYRLVSGFLGGRELVMEETTTNDVYATGGGSIDFSLAGEDFDATKRFNTVVAGDTLYVAFNGIQTRNTPYFYPGSDTLTLTSYATTDSSGLLEYKAALWMLTDSGAAQYVSGCTLYFTTGGDCYTGTFTGLDTSKRYKLTLSYDSGTYYVTGGLTASPMASGDLLVQEGEEGTENAAA